MIFFKAEFYTANNLTSVNREKLKNLFTLWTSYFQAHIASHGKSGLKKTANLESSMGGIMFSGYGPR